MLYHHDRAAVETFLATLLLDETVVLARVVREGEPVAAKVRPGSEGIAANRLTAADPLGALHSFRRAVIHAAGQPVGEIQIVASRRSLRRTVYRQLYLLVALVLLVGAASLMSAAMIVRRFHSEPLRGVAAIGDTDGGPCWRCRSCATSD